MKHFLLVFIGGGLGSYIRFLFSVLMAERLGGAFPFTTLAVNIAGCFLIGLFTGLPATSEFLSPSLRLFLITGFVGGLTTFSTYEFESYLLFNAGFPNKALLNIIGSVVLGFLAVGLGHFSVRWLQGMR